MSFSQQTKEATTANLLSMPVMKSYNPSQIITSAIGGNSIDTRATKNITSIFKLALIGGLGFCAVKWILPPVFIALGKLVAVAATIVGVVAFIIFFPRITRGLKYLAKELDKRMINKDPFGVLDLVRVKMLEGLTTTRVGYTKFSKFKDDAMNESERYEKIAKDTQRTITLLRKEVNEMKAKLDAMIATNGPDYAGESPYINLDSQYQKKLADSLRLETTLVQAKDFVERYGTRSSTIQKVLKKVKNGETALEIKIADFDATYAWLKEQYKFAKEAKFVSTEMKDALLFEKEWQFLFAIDAISNTILNDMAVTSSNFKDLESMTNQYALNPDEMLLKLNELADNIDSGKDVVTESKRYENPNVELTQKEIRKSGFGNVEF